jgi:hypothetical protein
LIKKTRKKMKTIMKKTLAGMATALLLAACGSTAFAQGTGSNFQKNPYLLFPGYSAGNNTNDLGINTTGNIGNTEMEVVWQDTVSQTDTISWGTTTAYGHSASSTELTAQPINPATSAAYCSNAESTPHQHMYMITGLTPSTKYYYSVTGTSLSANGSFMTAPAPNATAVQFLGAGDSRSDPAALANIQAMMTKFVNQPGNANFGRLIILNGDYVSSDGESNWTSEYFYGYTGQQVFSANTPMAGAKGNHEDSGGYSGPFAKYLPYPFMQGNTTYHGSCQATSNDPFMLNYYGSFDYGPVHIAVVDEYSSFSTGSAQLNWLQADLAAARANPSTPWIILMYHEPAYGTGSDGDNTNAQKYLEPLVAEYGVDFTYSGHNHNFVRAGAYNSAQAGAVVLSGGAAPTPGVPHITSGGGATGIYQPKLTNLTSANYPNIQTAWPAMEFMTFNVNGLTLTMTAYQVNSIPTGSTTYATAATNFQTTVAPPNTMIPTSQLSISPIETIVLNHFTQLNSLTCLNGVTGSCPAQPSKLTITPAAVNCTVGASTTTCTSSVAVKNTSTSTIAGPIDVVMDGMINLQGVGMNWLPQTTATACASKLQNQYSKDLLNGSTGGLICSAIAANTGLYDKVTLVNATSSQNGEPLVRATSNALAAGASVVAPLTFTYPNVVNGTTGTYLNSTMSACCTVGSYDSQPVSTITWCSGTSATSGQPYGGINGTGGNYCLNPIVYQE